MPNRLMMITNDIQMITLVQELLTRYPVEVVVKETLRRGAQSLVHEESPELVILDLSVHMSDGYDFLRKMRSIKRFADLPILVTVAEPDPDVIKEALQAGANRYLTKTFLHTNFLRLFQEMRDKSMADKALNPILK